MLVIFRCPRTSNHPHWAPVLPLSQRLPWAPTRLRGCSSAHPARPSGFAVFLGCSSHQDAAAWTRRSTKSKSWLMAEIQLGSKSCIMSLAPKKLTQGTPKKQQLVATPAPPALGMPQERDNFLPQSTSIQKLCHDYIKPFRLTSRLSHGRETGQKFGQGNHNSWRFSGLNR